MPAGTATVHIRPTVDRETVEHLVHVQELLIELVDDEDGTVRIVEIGRKRLPDADADSPNWGYVRAAGSDAEQVRKLLGSETYSSPTQGEQHQSATTVAAEGDWDLRRSGATTFLRLRLQSELDAELVDELQLHQEAIFEMSAKNPRAGGDAGLEEDEKPELPEELQALFDGNRWAPVDPVALLDHPGVEFVLAPVQQEG